MDQPINPRTVVFKRFRISTCLYGVVLLAAFGALHVVSGEMTGYIIPGVLLIGIVLIVWTLIPLTDKWQQRHGQKER